MHMNQVAIAYSSDEEKAFIKASLGLTDAPWVKDTVKAKVSVLQRTGDYVYGDNVAELEFCMAMGGTQFELIRYTSGPNWIAEAKRLGVAFPMVAHIGFHLDEGEAWPPIEIGGVLAQEAMTEEHSNEDVNAAGRRYHYRIYRVGPSTYLKFIKRMTVGQWSPSAVKGLEAEAPHMETDVMVGGSMADSGFDGLKATEDALKGGDAAHQAALKAAGIDPGTQVSGAQVAGEPLPPTNPGLADAEHSGQGSAAAGAGADAAGGADEGTPKPEKPTSDNGVDASGAEDAATATGPKSKGGKAKK